MSVCVELLRLCAAENSSLLLCGSLLGLFVQNCGYCVLCCWCLCGFGGVVMVFVLVGGVALVVVVFCDW